MQTKNVLYAAVGAPVMAARKVKSQISTLKGKLGEERASYTEAAEKAINEWAAEGEKIVAQLSKGKVVEEISAKVDLDQAKEQVSKLRDQIEDILATWRASFRPEKVEGNGAVKETEAPVDSAAAATAPKTTKPRAKTAAEKPAGKASATGATKATAAKTSSAKAASTPRSKTAS